MSAKTARPPAQAPTVSNADVASLQVSLPQMLDLALGTPEVGAVNLNILHNFLHVLLHQINLRSTKVEYRGEDANRIKTMVGSLKAGPTLHLHEYSITDSSGKVKHRIQSTDTFTVNVDVLTEAQTEEKLAATKLKGSPRVSVTEREKSSKEKGAKASTEKSVQEETSTRKTKGVRQEIGPGTEGEHQTVIFVEPIVDGIAPTALGFKQLEQSVNELQQRFQALEELSTNPELVERLKGRITDPLTDVWQIINITKRLDASEQGIDKLTKMLQDVIKGDATITATEDTSQFTERLTNLENAVNEIEQTVNNLQVIASMTAEEVQTSVTPAEASTPAAVNVPTADQDETQKTEATAAVEEAPRTVTSQPPTQRISLSKLLGGIDLTEMQGEVTALKTEVSKMRKNVNDLNEKMTRLPAGTGKNVTVTPAETATTQQTVQEVGDAEQKEKEISQEQSTEPTDVNETDVKTVEHKEVIHADALQKINERIEKLEKDVTSLSEKVDSAPTAGATDDTELNELVSKIQGIQTDMEKLNQTADHLIDDRENREVHLNALLEQVELLKTIKADKEDLEDALADKADAQAVNRKVSYDQFDAACDDLARGLEDAIGKLGKQESIWQQALDEVQKEIEGKVDKMEISPLRDFVTNRLKSLQEKLKNMAEMRRESEAAGTKKMLRDVQCISCDKNVVMRMENVNKFRVEPLPCTMSMKPYLTYELDQVRKQQRRLPHSRNMIQFEAALQEEARKQKSARTETLVKTPRDHLCNRYCGGSHTVTTPQQRVKRVGHFLSQWGPEIVQLTEGVIKGSDGKMYRSRTTPGKPDVCGPYCEEQVEEEVRASDRPAPVAAPTAPATHTAHATSRKSVEKRASTASRRRSSRKQSSEVQQSTKEPVVEQTTAPVVETPPAADSQNSVPDQNVVSMEDSTTTDQVVRYEEEETEHEMEHGMEHGME